MKHNEFVVIDNRVEHLSPLLFHQQHNTLDAAHTHTHSTAVEFRFATTHENIAVVYVLCVYVFFVAVVFSHVRISKFSNYRRHLMGIIIQALFASL